MHCPLGREDLQPHSPPSPAPRKLSVQTIQGLALREEYQVLLLAVSEAQGLDGLWLSWTSSRSVGTGPHCPQTSVSGCSESRAESTCILARLAVSLGSLITALLAPGSHLNFYLVLSAFPPFELKWRSLVRRLQFKIILKEGASGSELFIFFFLQG